MADPDLQHCFKYIKMVIIFLILKTLKVTRVKIYTVALQIPLSLLTHTHLKNTSSTVGQIKMSAALSLVADLSLSHCDSLEKITDCL